jgi:hypothetical protein
MIACALVIRPVPIEPAEKKKRMKQLENLEQKNSQNINIDVIGKTEIKRKPFKESIQSLIDFSLFCDKTFMFFVALQFLAFLGDQILSFKTLRPTHIIGNAFYLISKTKS